MLPKSHFRQILKLRGFWPNGDDKSKQGSERLTLEWREVEACTLKDKDLEGKVSERHNI